MTDIKLVPIVEIIYDDEERHRKELDGIDELVASILKIRKLNPTSLGLLHPIILGDENKLLAGRRRLEAFKSLGDTLIPARYFADLSPTDQKLVELDENLRRVDISWQNRCLAILELHSLLGNETATQTADYIGLHVSHVARYLQVANELRKGDTKIAACNSAAQAIAIVNRRQTLALDDELSKLHQDIVKPISVKNSDEPIATENPQAQPYSIIQENFLTWAPNYSGPKFNFIHCDFPYGIDAQDSASMSADQQDSQYEDSPEIFFNLLNCLTDNIDALMYDSGHIMFWYHMKFHGQIVDHFRANGFFVVELPLIWFKSDGMGVAADYRRRPKHVYETALFMSRGDRFISNVINDCYPCPTARSAEGHMSAKPMPMLKHFFSMMVNDLSSVLDPTCGSGTSIRAAASLNAERALGLEINPAVIPTAQKKLLDFVRLSAATSKMKTDNAAAGPQSLKDL